MTLSDTIPRFRASDRQSTPGSRINEDGLGLHGRSAWIMDGATGVSSERLTDGGSDAAWLVDIIDRTVGKLSGEGCSAMELLQHVEAEVRRAFVAATAHRPGSAEHSPSACFGLIQAQSAASGYLCVEGFFLGDVVALVPSEKGITRWTDERAKPFERKTLAALEAGRHEPGEVPAAVRRQILENRTQVNQPGGYFVVNPCHPWAGHELRFTAAVREGEPIVLATDGFMRLVDVFGAYSDHSLHAALAAGRAGALMEELRTLECNDLLSGRYPRVKRHDDATVLVIVAETDG